MKQHKEHRKKQKGLADSEEPVVEEVPLEADPGTTLATQSTSAGPFLGRVVSAENAKLYLSLVNTALREPLPALDFADPAGLPLKEHQEMVHRCKQKLAYEEQVLNRRYWAELRKVGGQLANADSYRFTMEKSLQEAEEKMHKAYSDAGRLVEEAEQKAKAAVVAEAVRVKAEYERRLEQDLTKAKKAAVLAYRRDRGRAVEQATAFIDGGVYILGKIKEAFPEQDWSQLPVPELTDELVEDEHKAILEEVDREVAGGAGKQ